MDTGGTGQYTIPTHQSCDGCRDLKRLDWAKGDVIVEGYGEVGRGDEEAPGRGDVLHAHNHGRAHYVLHHTHNTTPGSCCLDVHSCGWRSTGGDCAAIFVVPFAFATSPLSTTYLSMLQIGVE